MSALWRLVDASIRSRRVRVTELDLTSVMFTLQWHAHACLIISCDLGGFYGAVSFSPLTSAIAYLTSTWLLQLQIFLAESTVGSVFNKFVSVPYVMRAGESLTRTTSLSGNR